MSILSLILLMSERIFDFLSLKKYTNSYLPCKNNHKPILNDFLFYLLLFIFTFCYKIPFFMFFIIAMNFSYIFLTSTTSFFEKVRHFLIYELLYLVFNSIIILLHTFLTLSISSTNPDLFFRYTAVIESLMFYFVLSISQLFRKFSHLPSGNTYKHYIILSSIFTIGGLVFCSIMFQNMIFIENRMLPIIFAALLFIFLLFISMFNKILSILEENMHAKLEIEKNTLLQDYYYRVESNLETLSNLRHDFKNHLLILRDYGNKPDHQKFNDYLTSLQADIEGTALINTPSPILSAILNTKVSECHKKNIPLSYDISVVDINIPEPAIVTILGNIIDNAIYATGRCSSKNIILSIKQLAGVLRIQCINSHNETLLLDKNNFFSTKKDYSMPHGLGIKNVRKTVTRLGGTLEILASNKTFEIDIIIPNHNYL